MSGLTWAGLRREAAERLASAGVASPDAEARWLVEECAPDVDGPVTERSIARFDALLARREAGEPLQYVLGHWAFRSLDLLVDRRVLIPRPETEVVAGVAIDEARRLVAALDPFSSPHPPEGESHRDQNGGLVAVDLGTGSGAIAVSLAVEVPGLAVWGVDRSAEALAVARANVAGAGRPGGRVRLVEGDWFDALPGELRGRVAVAAANPPYVADGEVLPAEVAEWEPVGALRSGADGLDALRRIVAHAPGWLARPGSLVLECAPHQADEVAGLARGAGFDDVAVLADLTGRPRCVRCRIGGTGGAGSGKDRG